MRGENDVTTTMNQFADEYYYYAADYHDAHRPCPATVGYPVKNDGDYVDYVGGPPASITTTMDPSYYYDPGYCGYGGGGGPYAQDGSAAIVCDNNGWSPPGPHDYPAGNGPCEWPPLPPPPWDDDRPPVQPLLPQHHEQQPLSLAHSPSLPPLPGVQRRQPELPQPTGYGHAVEPQAFHPARGRCADQEPPDDAAADRLLFSKRPWRYDVEIQIVLEKDGFEWVLFKKSYVNPS